MDENQDDVIVEAILDTLQSTSVPGRPITIQTSQDVMGAAMRAAAWVKNLQVQRSRENSQDEITELVLTTDFGTVTLIPRET